MIKAIQSITGAVAAFFSVSFLYVRSGNCTFLVTELSLLCSALLSLLNNMCVQQLEITLQMRSYMFCSVDGVPIY